LVEPQGYTLGGVVRVWRTGVGVDARGNLIYVAAPDQTVITLAHILQHVGAVRAAAVRHAAEVARGRMIVWCRGVLMISGSC
jgi:hypothetical protein